MSDEKDKQKGTAEQTVTTDPGKAAPETQQQPPVQPDTPVQLEEPKAPKAAEPKKTNKAVLSDKDMEKVTLTTAEQLKRQKKVNVKLYLDPGKRKELEAALAAGKKVVWPYTTVQINGYTYQIQYGKDVEVPESVAEVLKNADMI